MVYLHSFRSHFLYLSNRLSKYATICTYMLRCLSIPAQPLLLVAFQLVRGAKPRRRVGLRLDPQRRVGVRVLSAAQAGVAQVVQRAVGDLQVADELLLRQ